MAEAFGRHLVPIPFAGPALAAGLLGAIRHELAGPAIDGSRRITLALDHDLFGVDPTRPPAVAWDAAGADAAVALCVDPDGAKVLLVEWTAGERLNGADLTRSIVALPKGLRTEVIGEMEADQVMRWQAFALSVLCADMVGVMDGGMAMAIEHAKQRVQFASPIGSFQAVQHICAEQVVSIEGARSATYHSAWAVDGLAPADALAAARTAKAYVSREVRTVGEAVLQVHGGIGQTWESLAHVYLRRGLLDRSTLGDEYRHAAALAEAMVTA